MDGMKKLWEGLRAWKYVLLVAALGLVLLAIPGGGTAAESGADEESRLEALLGRMEGVGEVEVLLSEAGAAVVCQGAESAETRWDICQVLRCYAGFGTERIGIFKME